MLISHSKKLAIGATLLLFSSGMYAHGLVQDPPSRNWYCGAITKPDEVINGTAAFPECGAAFENDFNGGYQFMSVLTHAEGRAVVQPLPEHVCGFGSETFNGGPTPWDTPIDWPTNAMSAGRQEFTWNISWGPHFDDTDEFRYWITNPDFQYQVGQPLSWDQFESNAFCVLKYDDANPGANPDIIPDKPNTLFHTFCEVPAREGRHVIYAEWGRNFFTFERFHGCIDVTFDGGINPPPTEVMADIALVPNQNSFVGAGEVSLIGSGSSGQGLSYQWSVSSQNPALYSIENPNQADTRLLLAQPDATATVSIMLLVSDGNVSDSETVSFSHVPTGIPSQWTDLGPISQQPQSLNVGDQVSVRTVTQTGQDNYFPDTPLLIDAQTTAADAWPYALALSVNQLDAEIAIGVLNSNDEVIPLIDATANRIYARTDANIASAFLEIEPVIVDPPVEGDCNITIRDGNNPWWAGLDVGTDLDEFELDFSATGLDLSQVTVDQGVFNATVNGQIILLSKPSWVTLNNPGFLGLNGSNVSALGTLAPPTCLAVQ